MLHELTFRLYIQMQMKQVNSVFKLRSSSPRFLMCVQIFHTWEKKTFEIQNTSGLNHFR